MKGLYLRDACHCHCEEEAVRRLTKQSLVMDKQYYVYIMANDTNTVTYTGVTSDLRKRVYEHQNKLVEGFTNRYNIRKLVYYEVLDDATSAIAREKQIKGGSRLKKIELIHNTNKEWRDLYDEI